MLFVGSRPPNITAYNGNPVMGNPLNSTLCHRQPLNKLMHSKGCSLILCTSLLAVGITITVMSLQSFSSANKIFLIGPILMTVGILGLSRSLMQYFKRLDSRRRRLESRERARARRTQQQGTQAAPQPPPRCIVSVAHRIVQREDSEEPIYIGPTDSEDNGYSDDPPPYDAVATTGRTVASHIQNSGRASSSLPSLPPYDEGLVNPGLDLSTEAFPAPPPYEIVAIQPPCYTPNVPVEGFERPIYGLAHTMRGRRTKARGSLPTTSTVQEVADRLIERLQSENRLASASDANVTGSVLPPRQTGDGQDSDHDAPQESEGADDMDRSTVQVSEDDQREATHAECAPREEAPESVDLDGVTPRASVSSTSVSCSDDFRHSEIQAGECRITLDFEPAESHTDTPYVHSLRGNNNDTDNKSENDCELEGDHMDTYLNNNQMTTQTLGNENIVANEQFEKHLNIALPIADPLN